jgi:hypothetical protein
VSKHWRPDGKIVPLRPTRGRGAWDRADGYLPADATAPSRLVAVIVGAVVLGICGGGALAWIDWGGGNADPASAIEWNAVQAVPN